MNGKSGKMRWMRVLGGGGDEVEGVGGRGGRGWKGVGVGMGYLSHSRSKNAHAKDEGFTVALFPSSFPSFSFFLFFLLSTFLYRPPLLSLQRRGWPKLFFFSLLLI